MSRLVYRAVEPFPDSASPRAQTEFEDVYHGVACRAAVSADQNSMWPLGRCCERLHCRDQYFESIRQFTSLFITQRFGK